MRERAWLANGRLTELLAWEAAKTKRGHPAGMKDPSAGGAQCAQCSVLSVAAACQETKFINKAKGRSPAEPSFSADIEGAWKTSRATSAHFEQRRRRRRRWSSPSPRNPGMNE